MTLVTPQSPVTGPLTVLMGAGAPFTIDRQELALKPQPELAFTQMSPLKLPVGKVTVAEVVVPVMVAPGTVVDHT